MTWTAEPTEPLPRPLDTAALLAFPLHGTHLIEAGAGTGKTYTIAALYLRHVLSGRAPERILVVTFTKAATEELKGRIRDYLYAARSFLSGGPVADALLAAIASACPDRDAALAHLELALHGFDRAAVYSIHGFCQRTLADQAFPSGQAFDFEVREDDREARLEALRDWWRCRFQGISEAEAEALTRVLGDTPDAFFPQVEPLLSSRPLTIDPPPRDWADLRPRLEALADALAELLRIWAERGPTLRALLEESPALSREKRFRCALSQALAWLDASLDGPAPAWPPDLLSPLGHEALKTKLKKTAKDPVLEAEPFFERCDRLLTEAADLGIALGVQATAEAAAETRTGLARRKDREGVLAYDDLLLRLRDALRREGGEALAAHLRERHPVALIDEFQDTDPIQYEIFERIYLDQGDCAWTLIGDPKQAIYGFRGGDIHTYLAARERIPTAARYTLAVNWRSQGAVLDAINRLFQGQGSAPFLDPRIQYIPLEPAPEPRPALERDGRLQPGLRLWHLVSDQVKAKGGFKPLTKGQAETRIHAAVAAEVARLLSEGRSGRARIAGRPVAPGDIAILARTHAQAAAAQAALEALGVAAAIQTRDGVFQSPEAEALADLLETLAAPRDRTLARRALASPLLALDPGEVQRRLSDDEAWAAWLRTLDRLHLLWYEQGFMPMFQALLRDLDLPRALARRGDAERGLANLLHLGELLQAAARQHPDPEALNTWLRRQRAAREQDETLLRLESDAERVRILTVHVSKGLQFPVCFLPALWAEERPPTPPFIWHEAGTTHLSFAADERALAVAQRQGLGEALRLAYVALTRAQSALYVAWASVGSQPGRSALSRLLLGLEGPWPERTEILERLNALGRPGVIEVEALPEDRPEPPLVQAPPPPLPPLDPPRIPERIAWRVTSFSALARNLAHPGHPDDAPAEDHPAFRLPAGTQVGLFLHEVLERLDFQADLATLLPTLVPRLAARHGLRPEDYPGDFLGDLQGWLGEVLATPLGEPGLCLADLPPEQRLNELEFHFATGPTDGTRIDALLGHPGPALTGEAFQGLVNGVIDLVFRAGGRYWLADYKSNLLGRTLASYASERLPQAIAAHRYDLQARLYALALHRFLGQRLPGYRYERHFGGCLYLFLRGMRPDTGPACGIWHLRPTAMETGELDRLFAPQAAHP